MREILNLHLVNERYSAEKIRSNNNQVCAKIRIAISFTFILFAFLFLKEWKKGSSMFFMHNIPFSLFLSQIIQVPTNVDKKFLYFNVLNQGDNKTITVEGSGVNATIIQSDIAATNGFVHIIDHVLGVPYTSVLEKLQTDPMLK